MRRTVALLGIAILVAGITAISLSALSRRRADDTEHPAERRDTYAADLPDPELVAINSSVPRGRSTTVVLHPSPGVTALSVVLEDAEGEEASAAAGFQVFPVRDVAVWIAKIGVPNTAPAGEYTARASATFGGETEEFTTEIEVEHVEFFSMEIALSSDMTALRRDPHPERTREAREMIALLTSYRLDGRYYQGRLQLPVDYRRRSAGFGDRRVYRYYDGQRATAVHSGVDMAAPTGEPVYAAGGGKISFSDDRIISGNSVVIEHLPGVYGVYYHLDNIAVEEDQVVRAGEQIGTVGATGLVTGPHLHWELRIGGVPVDPDQFVEAPLVDKAAIFSTIMAILRAPGDDHGVTERKRG